MDKKDITNFAAWSNKNLADLCTEAYICMQEQQEALEQAQGNFKDAMNELRKKIVKGD